ncbi:MAG: hypothetical protein J7K00_04380 [Candidatus Diapherotrites archaeon]|nr:hypothetical protein [Candidatus Diapherotrites archaeon]
MFDLFKKLMVARQIRFDEGCLVLLGQAVVMTPNSTLVKIQESLSKYGLENIIYYSAKETGLDWFIKMNQSYGISIKNMPKWGIDTVSLAGFGRPKVLKLDIKNKQSIINLENSIMSEYIGRNDKYVDHLFRGFIAGTATMIFGEPSDAIEVKCKSKGDAYCQFVLKPTNQFDLRNKEVKEQLSLPQGNKKGV